MTQPIDRETAIALAKEADMLVLSPDNPLYKDHSLLGNMSSLQRLCNLAVAHSRKDAEPVQYQYRMKPEWHDAWVKWQPCDKANFDDYVKAPVINGWQFDARALFTHPPDADKLLQQALEAVLDEHLPGFTEDAPRQHDDVIYDKAIEDAADAIQQLIARTYQEEKK